MFFSRDRKVVSYVVLINDILDRWKRPADKHLPVRRHDRCSSDHQVLLSIYVFDPTSNCRLELTTPLTRLSDQGAKDAEQARDQWEVWREEATASGRAFGGFLRQKLQMRAKHVA
jgi:hypothetical protein